MLNLNLDLGLVLASKSSDLLPIGLIINIHMKAEAMTRLRFRYMLTTYCSQNVNMIFHNVKKIKCTLKMFLVKIFTFLPIDH